MLMYGAADAKLGLGMHHLNPVLLAPAVQHYAWGSATDFPRLFGVANPKGEPMAELWYGTHPDGPTKVCDHSGSPTGIDLRSQVQHYPEQSIGAELAQRFGSELPFLLKVIAAAQPLSLQAHPSKEQAEEGFAREEAQGVPVSAPNRSYRDRNHKPELIAALTPFSAMVGFRDPPAIAALIAPLGPEAEPLLEALTSGGIKGMYDGLVGISTTRLRSIISSVTDLVPATDVGEENAQEEAALQALCYRTLLQLFSAYPNDPGVLAPLYLNVLRLEPGQALYLPAGILHAYLHGVGVEIMANSNNVLRGGLTSKFIDRAELRRVVRFAPYQPPVLNGVASHEYPTSFEEFALTRLDLAAKQLVVARPRPGPEILLCTHGRAIFQAEPNVDVDATVSPAQPLELSAGKAIFVPAACSAYALSGPATVFRATVGTAPA